MSARSSATPGRPVTASQVRAMPSSDPVATSTWPDGEAGENATAVTELPCPARVATGTPVATSQMVAVLSVDAMPSSAPEGSNATALR